MKTALIVLAAAVLCAASLWSLPTVDGRVIAGEYSRSVSLLDGATTVYYQVDDAGGLYLAVSAATSGWVGIGLGSVVMDGAHIFMGYLKDGAPVFSEQVGDGHGHHSSPGSTADASAVGQKDGVTTIEFHIPAGALPLPAGKINFITAFSGSADLSTYHEDNRDSGSLDLTRPK
ncbi:MAG: DOMON domain-containing protein [Spirochaetia bacterium]|jgi:hypothetical protein